MRVYLPSTKAIVDRVQFDVTTIPDDVREQLKGVGMVRILGT